MTSDGERGIESEEHEAPFGFMRNGSGPSYDGVPMPRAQLKLALEQEQAARAHAELTASRLAVKLTSEHERRIRAEWEAQHAVQQIELARAQRKGFMGGRPHRRKRWRRTWRRVRHGLRR